MEQETTFPANWAIDVAIQRSGVHWSPEPVKAAVRHGTDSPLARAVIELARLIERHEEPPVDADFELVKGILTAFRKPDAYPADWTSPIFAEAMQRALAYYKQHKGGSQ